MGKTNPVPHAVTDRLSNSYDFVYFLTRAPRYFFDLDAIRLPYRDPTGKQLQTATGLPGKNPGDVWMLPSANFRGAHFATFPQALVERPLLATCPELICDRCGTVFRDPAAADDRNSARVSPKDLNVTCSDTAVATP